MLDGKDVHRVVFYEITKNAMREAISQPRDISQDLVNAQQARRALDYLVGFNLSPLLWKKAGLPRRFRRPRAEPGAAHDLRARGRNSRLRAAASTGRIDADAEQAPSRLPGCELDRVPRREGRAVHGDRTKARPPMCARTIEDAPRSGKLSVANIDQEAAPAQSGAAVHDLDAATGSRPQARLRRSAAPCASRSSCTKAWTSAKARSVSSPICVRTRVNLADEAVAEIRAGHRQHVRRGRSAPRRRALVQDEVEERPGSARSHSPDVRRHRARADSQARSTTISSSSIQPDLEARGRVARWKPRGVRHRRRRPGARHGR